MPLNFQQNPRVKNKVPQPPSHTLPRHGSLPFPTKARSAPCRSKDFNQKWSLNSGTIQRTGPGILLHGCLYKQTGRHSEQAIDEPNLRDLPPSRKKLPFSFCGISHRQRKSPSGLSKPTRDTSGRLVPQQISLPKDHKVMGSSTNRPICHQGKSPSPKVLFLKSVRSPRRNRRLLHSVELESSICISHTAGSKSPEENPGGPSPNNSNSPILAKENLVLPPKKSVGGRSLGTTDQAPSTSRAHSPSAHRQATSSGLDIERQILKNRGFSDPVISTMQHSRKLITHKMYFKVWQTFIRFCGDSQVEFNLSKVLDFFTGWPAKGSKTSHIEGSGVSLIFIFLQILGPGSLGCQIY